MINRKPWIPPTHPALAVLLALLATPHLAGCGYHWGSPHRQGIQTVYVEMFKSREFRRELEFQLTEALQKRIEMDTPYKVADRNNADTMLYGQVVAAPQSLLSDDFFSDLPRELQLQLVVDFTWQDLRTRKVLCERRRFKYASDYVPELGESVAIARHKVVDGLSEAIVEQMMQPW